jgi:hypothetical protein
MRLLFQWYCAKFQEFTPFAHSPTGSAAELPQQVRSQVQLGNEESAAARRERRDIGASLPVAFGDPDKQVVRAT